MTDDWMDAMIASKTKAIRVSHSSIAAGTDRFAEFDKYLNDPVIPRVQCEDTVAWWGVSLNVFESNECFAYLA